MIDSFSNLDEFEEWADVDPRSLFHNMGRYYLIKMSLIYDQISGIITMMAAIFTVTWMQRNNELLAMLAAGISTQRVIRPVLISAWRSVSSLGGRQPGAHHAEVRRGASAPAGRQRLPAQEGLAQAGCQRGLDPGGSQADRSGRIGHQVSSCDHPGPRWPARLIEIAGREAIYIPEDDLDQPRSRGGWLLWGAKFLTEPVDGVDTTRQTKGVLTEVEDPSACPQPKDKLAGKAAFARLLPQDRPVLLLAHPEPSVVPLRPDSRPDPGAVGPLEHRRTWATSRSSCTRRIIRPLLGFNLMLLSLPLVLGGTGRNMFVNLGMSLGTSGMFYSVNFISQYLGGHEVYSPEMAAWAPLILFGTLA